MTTYARSETAAEGASFSFGTSRARTIIIAATLALGAAVVATVLLFRPWPVRNSFLYNELAPVRDGIWTSILVDSVAFAAVAIGLSLVVAQMTPTRGVWLANIGAVVATAGGVLFAMGAFAFAMFTWYVTDAAAPDRGRHAPPRVRRREPGARNAAADGRFPAIHGRNALPRRSPAPRGLHPTLAADCGDRARHRPVRHA